MDPKPIFEDGANAQNQQVDTQESIKAPSVVLDGSDKQLPQAVPVSESKPLVIPNAPDPVDVGKTLQNISQVSKKVLSETMAADTGIVGDNIAKVISTAKGMVPDGKPSNIVDRLKSFFIDRREQMIKHVQTSEQQIVRLVGELEKSRDAEKQRIGIFEEMYYENERAYMALKAALEQTDAQVQKMQAEMNALPEPKDAFEAQQIRDFQEEIDKRSRDADNYRRIMTMAVASAPQIRQMQSTSKNLVDTFDNIVSMTIPLMRNTTSAYIMSLQQKKGAELAKSVSDMNDQALKDLATMSGQNAIAAAKAKERPIVATQTLEHVKDELIKSFTEVGNIEKEARQARIDSRANLQKIEGEIVEAFTKA